MAVLTWTWLTVFVATVVDGVPRQHVERSHHCVLPTSTNCITQHLPGTGRISQLSVFSPGGLDNALALRRAPELLAPWMS